jgi:hypothetical protein
LPCVMKKRTAKIIYRALSDAAHDKDALPCKMLPCALCRVFLGLCRALVAHGKAAVSRCATGHCSHIKRQRVAISIVHINSRSFLRCLVNSIGIP